jgi:hypothetical protein
MLLSQHQQRGQSAGRVVWYPQLRKGAIILLGAAADVGRRQVARESAPAPDRVTR